MTQEFVTLPREVAERALKSMLDARCSVYDGFEYDKAATALAAAMEQTPALEQPKNHVPDAGNMVPAGWKLVPVEPTRGMLDAAHRDLVRDAEIDMMLKGIHSAMLDAAPKPPTVKDSFTVEQPQVEQEPAETFDEVWAAIDWDKWRMEPIRELVREIHSKTSPQPKREPLTDEEIDKINRSTTWPVKSLASLGDRQWAELLRCAARAIEAAHNIK